MYLPSSWRWSSETEPSLTFLAAKNALLALLPTSQRGRYVYPGIWEQWQAWLLLTKGAPPPTHADVTPDGEVCVSWTRDGVTLHLRLLGLNQCEMTLQGPCTLVQAYGCLMTEVVGDVPEDSEGSVV